MNTLKRVLIMAGGTGGHVFPGLALAKYLQEQNVEVHWLGTRQGLEARLVSQSNIPLHFITINGLRGKGIFTLLKAPFKIIAAIFQSLKVLFKLKPDVVIGMGGFVSGPGGIAAWLSRKPLVIHEQNAKAGLTNQWLKKFSRRVLTGFPNVFSHENVYTVGNPVRAEIAGLLPPIERLQRQENKLRLLVLGGSLGAQAINEIVPRAIASAGLQQHIDIYHQTGEKLYESAVEAYQKAGVTAKVVPFISDMGEAYNWADIVLCRAGALTIAELCAAGLGSILVPFPHAVDDHQTANAKFLVDNNAAILVQQRDLTEDRLTDILKDLFESPEKRLAMANAAYELRRIDVSENIYQICLSI